MARAEAELVRSLELLDGLLELPPAAREIRLAAAPPELHPVVARPSGSFVSFTLHWASTKGSTSVSWLTPKRPASFGETAGGSSPNIVHCPTFG